MLTTDPNHPDLVRGLGDESPVPQNKVYLVLSEKERAGGFLRPVRTSYIHNSNGGPRHPLRGLTEEEKVRYAPYNYSKFEEYPDDGGGKIGRFWTEAQLSSLREPCKRVTTMGLALSETYATDPWFYGATYCVHCKMHRPLAEFSWEDGEPMDPNLWSDELLKEVARLKRARDEGTSASK